MQQMGMNQQMGMPQMDMQQMGMPQMDMQQMGMNPQMGMNQQMGMPQMGMPQMSQQDIVNKYGENYNGPIDMIGGGNKLIDMKYMLNDIKSSGQKKKTLNLKNEGAKQSGGGGRVIPTYINNKTDPFKTQESKDNATARYNEVYHAPPPNEKPPLMEFKLNNIIKPPAPHNQGMYPSAFIPIQNQYLPDGYPYVAGTGIHNQNPYSFVPNNVPVIQNYNISLPNPVGDHVKLADLYEDMLPNTGKYNNTSITLEERLIIYNYVRQVLVRIGDGEDININDNNIKETTNRKNLLSYLKLLDLNPYHNSRFTNNPYLSLPKKMLMYRSCYPIRLDPTTKKTTCSKYSIGLNLRIYEMTAAEYNIKKLQPTGNEIKHSEFNLWREVGFYEYVKEEIVKKKICPNFPIIYSWFISGGADIDFRGLKGLQNKYGQVDKYGKPLKNTIDDAKREALQLEYKNALTQHWNDENVDKLMVLNMSNGPYHFDAGGFLVDNKNKRIADGTNFTNRKFSFQEQTRINLSLKMTSNGQLELKVDDISKPANRCLLILTEAPNYNIIQWATKTYQHQILGPVKTMIQTGYHHENVWNNILFQLLAALHVMQLKQITFFEMTLQDNVYIKDLMNNEQTMGYWKYIINGFEYYIPNQGFLLLIDSNYKDIEQDISIGGVWSKPDSKIDKEIYKIYGNVDPEFENKKNQNIPPPGPGALVPGLVPAATTYGDAFDSMHLKNLKNILNRDNFGNAFKSEGGIRPAEKVLNKIGTISDILNVDGRENSGELDDIILDTMGMFLHNRVGTAVTESEYEKGISTVPIDVPIRGKMYARSAGLNNAYVWVIYISHNSADGNYKVKTRSNIRDNTSEIITSTIPEGTLFEYQSLEPIEQKYKSTEPKLGQDELLETYRIEQNRIE